MGAQSEDDQLIDVEREEPDGSKGQLKSALGHVGLLAALMLYTVVGGLVFRQLEYPSEINRLNEYLKYLKESRISFFNNITSEVQNGKTKSIAQVLNNELDKYEHSIKEAAKGGVWVPISAHENVTSISLAKWNHLEAIFFASTVLTTIGYGNLAPATTSGRVFCIIFALIGIPFTLTVIADLGQLIASVLPPIPDFRGIWGSILSGLFAVGLLLVFISLGAVLFYKWEQWNFSDAFYFCFVTMTTIGFGDIVPSSQHMLLCTIYVLIGLALTSTIIELVRQKYASTWQQLQALAETLGHLSGDQHSGDVQADLKKIMAVISLPKGKKMKDWEKAVQQLTQEFNKPKINTKVVQIIVYETSV
uniref:Potassium channel domain-containing protein n=1 Tax=Clastoptera arizonana TaxID=38151 RepID=A0A1B6C1I3_9HEMI